MQALGTFERGILTGALITSGCYGIWRHSSETLSIVAFVAFIWFMIELLDV
jgi:hypothetical protein